MRLDLTVMGERQVSRQLLRVGEHAINAMPAFYAVARMLREIELQRFDRQGPGWAPLAASTLAQKTRKGLDPRILRATERLRESLISSGGDHIEEITPLGLRFGTSVPYAGYHQKGTHKMPQRKVIDLSEAEKVALMKIVQRWVITGSLV